jgi:hypothetical protein
MEAQDHTIAISDPSQEDDILPMTVVTHRKTSTRKYLFVFMYRTVCLWFFSTAATCCLFSIPISIIGLPFVLLAGVWAAFCTLIISTIMRSVVQLINSVWKTVKKVMYSPLSLLGSFLNTLQKFRWGVSSNELNSAASTPHLLKRSSISSIHSRSSAHSLTGKRSMQSIDENAKVQGILN